MVHGGRGECRCGHSSDTSGYVSNNFGRDSIWLEIGFEGPGLGFSLGLGLNPGLAQVQAQLRHEDQIGFFFGLGDGFRI